MSTDFPMVPIQDGARYRIHKDDNDLYGLDSREKGDPAWGIIYEADFAKEYAEAMAAWLNKHGFVDWMTLSYQLEQEGITEKDR